MLLEFFFPRMLVPFIVLCLFPLTRLSFDRRDGPQVVTNPPLPAVVGSEPARTQALANTGWGISL